MKKIPTLFERDWNGGRSRVLNQVHSGCAWVLAGEGRATKKYDGTCCMIKDKKLFKRRELKKDEPIPNDFELAEHDKETDKFVGWVPVGSGPEDQYHREAWELEKSYPVDGTYELLGPKVQGNTENRTCHVLQPHNMAMTFPRAPRDFEGLKTWLECQDIEGLVFHHPDGRMAKIKLKDFGLRRLKTGA